MERDWMGLDRTGKDGTGWVGCDRIARGGIAWNRMMHFETGEVSN